MFEIKQSIFGIQVAFFKEIKHYFSIFFGFMREFLVALNASFTSTIEKGLALALEVTDARLEVTSFMFQIDLKSKCTEISSKG